MSQRMLPAFLTKDELLAVLHDIEQGIINNDSFEGSLSYEMPWNTFCDPVDKDDPPGGFRVRASYRTGNSMGQGGMRMIGEWSDVPS